ncbi:hypothetical protein LUZ60_012173 [Juncus effusus]|nr:hypothetical protein LUZ60_012172 [Juncus effusus]KAJ3693078.1 hypothetical protein LUZ60_012173 [Juncus effusus]
MGERELKLLGIWASPYAIRVRVVLNQKGLKYEYFEQDLTNKSELLLKYNPIHKKVPVLIDNDQPVCESLVILQYIDEAWSKTGPSVLPTDPYERAMARFWAVYIDDKVVSALGGILQATTEEAKANKIVETMSVLELLEETFKKCSKGKSFFGGDIIGFLDVILGSYVVWLKATEKISELTLLDENKFPKLVEWTEQFLSADYVKEVMPEVEKVEEFITKTVKPRWAAAASSK